MSNDLETDLEWFDDEPKKPQNLDNSATHKSTQSERVTSSHPNSDGFVVVHQDKGEAKGASGEIIIETAVKGLLYRCEVLKGGSLIDAREINCKDLLSNEEKDYIFKQRYMATHNTFKLQYIAEEFFKEVESIEGDFKDGDEEHCKVVTSISKDIIRTTIYVDGDEFETKEIKIKESIKNKKNLLEKRYQAFHLESVVMYIDVDKFPVNSFFNPILKKLPFYKKNPMHSFYLFILLVALLLFLAKFAYCTYLNGQDPKKLMQNRLGEQICHVLEEKCIRAKEDESWISKDAVMKKKMCKTACQKSIIGESACSQLFGSGPIGSDIPAINAYTITPTNTLVLSQQKITTIYVKNNTLKTLRFKVAGRSIKNNSNNEIVFFVNDRIEVTLDANEEGQFEVKLESTYIGSFSSGEYTGKLLFRVFNDDQSINKTEERNFKFSID